jgi:hypothetical protein
MVGAGLPTTMVNAEEVAVCEALSVTFTVNEGYEPTVVGVPLISPLVGFRLSPGGRLPLPSEYV